MVHTDRPGWDQYFHDIAAAVAARGDCRRSKVGAVLVSPDNRVCGTGFNGFAPGGPSCLKGDCPRGLLSYSAISAGSPYDSGPGMCDATHAEANAIYHSDPHRRVNSTLFITRAPCDGCRKIIELNGIARVVWPDGGEWIVGGSS